MRLWSFMALICALSFTANASPEVLMRLHGSNTIGAGLAPELVTSWLKSQGFTNIQKHNLADEEQLIVAIDNQGKQKSVEIKSHGSSTGFKSILENSADIAMSSRPIKADELQMLDVFGDLTSPKTEFVVGLDGIAVIVNKQNTITTLQKEFVKKIFSGEITNWSEIDPSMSGQINVYARDDKSGTYDTFKSLVMDKSNLVLSAKRYESNAQLSDNVSTDMYGIGFVGLPYIRDAKALGIAEKDAIAKYPDSFEVATEDYALSRRLYMYVPSVTDKPYIKSFMEFVLSKNGQHIVAKTGFVSQNIMAREVVLNPDYPEEYIQFTEQGKRLSMNIRFHKDSTRLDNKALNDIKRLSEFMSRDENRNKKVMLFSFSDEAKNLPFYSLDISTFRVDRVSDLMINYGINPIRVRSYGSEMPVASNEEPGGRHKNRRVEVWIQ